MVYLNETSSGIDPHDRFDQELYGQDGFENDSMDDRESLDFKPDAERIQQTNDLAIGLGIDEKKLTWKVDLCVVPPFILLYFLAFLDRINISNAKVYGMAEDLHLKGNEFNVALTIFFIPYVFFDVISNYMLQLVQPHIWLSCSCRFFLGVCEAGMFPACFYLLSLYYTGAESQKRFSIFFSCTCLSGAAGGAIAYKIHELDDFPESSRFMTLKEKEFIKRKLEIHSVESGYDVTFNWKDIIKSLRDPLYGLTSLAYFALVIPSYGYAYFSPSIIAEMGYTAVSANSHSIYPWLAAFGYTIVLAYISDSMKIRSPFAITSALLAITGLALVLGLKDHVQGRYAGCFLTVAGLYSAMPSLICWTNLNYGGHMRKSVGSATQIGLGNIGGIIATFVYLQQDAPYYTKGLSVGIAFCVVSIFTMISMIWFYKYRNDCKRTEDYRLEFFAQDDRTIVLEGDKHPSYKYLY
ncbi:putative transporter [Wickerhamomyces ciferrii]|uniref:Transporter n=1 Tax=Wickerhamomyces ciferrii (strain ATCC 14091 / BCRC 22168 / CBS 111 / JCM 3599 / NBRC 0793 / NRRL Y-1031 F-60-10) TaxID=1206466 RepID=K0KZP6_WICCF|nr:putative transporter [Wickerhamomyces ciferrii]CCH46799.1 putative transporter [Wickerhamomyces ciferrii]